LAFGFFLVLLLVFFAWLARVWLLAVVGGGVWVFGVMRCLLFLFFVVVVFFFPPLT
jgi:hypothetical protein